MSSWDTMLRISSEFLKRNTRELLYFFFSSRRRHTIFDCDWSSDVCSSDLTVFALGDNAYPNGTAATFQNCYDPTWGRHKARTYPVVGNHEYDSSATAASYFNYFGPTAGDPTKGYYSVDLGAWHIVVLNSNPSL